MAALIAIVAAPASAKQSGAAVRVSADPYSNPGAQHATEAEPDTFASDSTVVGAFMVGQFPFGAASNIGWATSQDGSKTFTRGFLPGISQVAGGPYGGVADPSVAYDAAHRAWLISSLGIGAPSGQAVVVSRSPDGVNWDDPVTVAQTAGLFDKDWIVCDNHRQSPFFGHCYAEFDDFPAGFRLLMSTSTDGGQTWGTPLETEGGGTGFGGQPVVQPDGTVVVPFIGPHAFPAENFIGAFRSTDGGESWSAPVTVSQREWNPSTGVRAAPFPSAGTDRAGHVYVAWHDCRFRAGCSGNDIVLSSSADGVDWSPVARVPIDPVESGADQFIPGLAVDPHTAGDHARLALTYYEYPQADCTPDTCELDVGFIFSVDGGASWSRPRELAGPMRLDWLPQVPPQAGADRFVGDYISTSFMHQRAVPFFAEANPPSGGSFDEAIATVPGGLPLGSCKGRPATHIGTAGNDTISGTNGRDVVVALGGADRIRTGRGKDLVCAGLGADQVITGGGSDRVWGGRRADRVLGGAGRDFLFGGPGPDRLFGGRGQDRIFGDPGRDLLVGGPGRDRLLGGPGRDRERQ